MRILKTLYLKTSHTKIYFLYGPPKELNVQGVQRPIAQAFSHYLNLLLFLLH